MTSDSERKAAEDQFPGEYTMFVDDSPMRFLHADKTSEFDQYIEIKEGHTSTKVHNRYLREAYILGRSSALKELEQVAREAIYYAWDAHKHLRNPELEVSNEEIFQDYLEQKKTESKGAEND